MEVMGLPEADLKAMLTAASKVHSDIIAGKEKKIRFVNNPHEKASAK